jgi:hypothetical protein
MTPGRLSYDDRLGLLSRVRRSAYHFERQRHYAAESAVFARWRAGDDQPPVGEPGFERWFGLVGERVRAGARFERVRVIDEPPTDYQRFEAWCGRWNIEAGEILRSLSRSQAEDLGIGHGPDWWLLDDEALIITDFDPQGQPVASRLVEDQEDLDQARRLWLAVLEHATVDAAVPGRR